MNNRGTCSIYSGKKILWEHCAIADNFFTRLIGLLRHKNLTTHQALLIKPCNSVHTLGMRFSIDILFLSKEMKVLKIVEALPSRRAARCANAAFALEVAAGQAHIKGINIGDELVCNEL